MASANFRFSNVAVYNVTRIEVKKGEKFSISLVDQQGDTKWLFYNDPVLGSKVIGLDAEITADEVGDSEIWIYDKEEKQVMKLFIKVVDAILPPASKLESSVGDPALKR